MTYKEMTKYDENCVGKRKFYGTKKHIDIADAKIYDILISNK